MMGFGRYGGFERGGWGGMWGGGHLFMGLLCLVFFIALIVWIIRMATWRRHGMGCGMGGMRHMHSMYDDRDLMQNRPDEALDILRKRFASGDMTKEEYEERLKVLNGEKQP
jgi:putative membrane protein